MKCKVFAVCVVVTTFAALISGGTGCIAIAAEQGDFPLLIDENFSTGVARWEPASPEGWKIIDIDGGKAYSEFHSIDISKKLPHRSPWNIALLKDFVVSDFVLEVRMRKQPKTIRTAMRVWSLDIKTLRISITCTLPR